MDEQRRAFDGSDGVRLSAIVAGAGRPLVLIHGWRQSARLFRHQVRYFSERRLVIAPDMRGHGRSDVAPGGYSIPTLASDLAAVLDQMDVTSCDIVGHSMGCCVIWEAIRQFGETRYDRLVFVDQAPLVCRPDHETRSSFSFAVSQQELNAICVAIQSPLAGFGYLKEMFVKEQPADFWALLRAENAILPRLHAASLYRDMAHRDWRDTLAATGKPALVVWGEGGAYSESSQRWIAESMPRGHFLKVPRADGGGHMPFLENPVFFNVALDNFLNANGL